VQVEALKYDGETWPRGGFAHLRRGLDMLRKANITVALDHHAAPGTSAVNQMFAGRCVDEKDMRFYDDDNLGRAYQFLSIMTALAYRDPVFDSVIAIMALNEPDLANHGPAYATYSERSIRAVRATEYALGISCSASHNFSLANVFGNAPVPPLGTAPSLLGLEDKAVQAALRDAEVHVKDIFLQVGLDDPWPIKGGDRARLRKRSPLQRQQTAARYLQRRLMRRGKVPVSELYCTINEHRAQTPFSTGALPAAPVAPSDQPKVRDRCLALGFMDKSWYAHVATSLRSAEYVAGKAASDPTRSNSPMDRCTPKWCVSPNHREPTEKGQHPYAYFERCYLLGVARES
jgi:hypothetical protein